MRGSSISRVVPRPATFKIRARWGEGAHSTSSSTSERGVPAQVTKPIMKSHNHTSKTPRGDGNQMSCLQKRTYTANTNVNIKRLVPGVGISRSVVCWTFVRPGLGSNAGTRAENCRFNTKSSSHVLRRPPLVSYSSSSCQATIKHHKIYVLPLCFSKPHEHAI